MGAPRRGSHYASVRDIYGKIIEIPNVAEMCKLSQLGFLHQLVDALEIVFVLFISHNSV